jgi:hypothetical protein
MAPNPRDATSTNRLDSFFIWRSCGSYTATPRASDVFANDGVHPGIVWLSLFSETSSGLYGGARV